MQSSDLGRSVVCAIYAAAPDAPNRLKVFAALNRQEWLVALLRLGWFTALVVICSGGSNTG
jgi:hypothetical protein